MFSALKTHLASIIAPMPSGDNNINANMRTPSRAELEVLGAVELAKRTSFDDDEPSHVALLTRLWVASFPFEPFERISPMWQSVGFQNKDPVKDLRGGGLLALRQLVHLAEKKPAVMAQLQDNRAGRYLRPDHAESPNYPIAAAAVGVSCLLSKLFGVRSTATVAMLRDTRQPAGFWLVASTERSYHDAFCWALQVLDSTYDLMDCNYMTYPHAWKAASETIENTLNESPDEIFCCGPRHAVSAPMCSAASVWQPTVCFSH